MLENNLNSYIPFLSTIMNLWWKLFFFNKYLNLNFLCKKRIYFSHLEFLNGKIKILLENTAMSDKSY